MPARFLNIKRVAVSLLDLCATTGGDEKERLEDGVGLLVEIFGVTKKSGALGREQRAGLLLCEELEGGRGVSDGQE